MSDENAIDLVMKNLDQQGQLTKVKAQIKASVFKILDQSKGKKSGASNFFWENEKAKAIQKDNELLLLLEVVKEFLQFFDFEFTLSVLQSESNHIPFIERDQLIKKIGLKQSDLNINQPILQHIYQKYNPKGAKQTNQQNLTQQEQIPLKKQEKQEPVKAGSKSNQQASVTKNQPITKTIGKVESTKLSNVKSQSNDFQFEEIEEDLDDVQDLEVPNTIKKNEKQNNLMLTSSEEQLASMSQGLDITVDSNEIDQYDHVVDIKWK
ncbi:unnamed protein product [Paramecium sonneborni]|uniref:FGFR1 oncogene partner (FOP) N-terminal dimerisation domain-containing protein n=1 Tax=Paramecium sonneborni TaxID=65129 RepID=A0A8S1M8X9_9CILI|nr:unnamed protein product [Paramecium sonneborni]